jgi:Ni,Fe-hydrogenase III component G
MARGNSRAQTEYRSPIPTNVRDFRDQNKSIEDAIGRVGESYDQDFRSKKAPTLREISEKVVAEEAKQARSKMDFEVYQNVSKNALDDLTKDEKDKMNKVLDGSLMRGLAFAANDQAQYDGYYPASYYSPERIMQRVKLSICLKYLEDQGNKFAGSVGPNVDYTDRSEQAKLENDAWGAAEEMDVKTLPKEYQMAILTAERDIAESYRNKNPGGVGSIAERKNPEETYPRTIPFGFSYYKPNRTQAKIFYMSNYGAEILNRPDVKVKGVLD